MAKKAGDRVKVILKCEECGSRENHTQKNKKNTPEKLVLNKFCAKCRKYTSHKEVK